VKQSDAIEAEIGKLEAKIAPMSDELDAKILAFSKALPAFAEVWITAEVKKQITANAVQFNEKGIEVARKLKADLADLVQKLPELCEEAVKNRAEWPHARTSTDARPIEFSVRVGESYFAKVFRNVISNAGQLLDTYHLIGTKGDHAWDRSHGQFRYAYNAGFDDNKVPVIAEYNRLWRQQSEFAHEIDAKREELAAARASELLDSA
jgi:hypothetical protein